MFNALSLLSIALVAASSVSAGILPRHRNINRNVALPVRAITAPASYHEGYLEAYATYHLRYMALGCENQHNSTFFADCCHPLLATEKLTSRPAECSPNATAIASASSAYGFGGAAATVTPTGDDGDCTDEPTSTSAAATGTPINVAPGPPVTTTAPSTPTTSHKASTTTHKTSSKMVTKTSTSKKSTSTSSSGSGSGQTFTGGISTYYTQGGVAGACGNVNSDSAMICALDKDLYSGGKYCGKYVEITNLKNGKKLKVKVQDECMGCKNANSIDLSTGAYKALGGTTFEGEFDITWQWAS